MPLASGISGKIELISIGCPPPIVGAVNIQPIFFSPIWKATVSPTYTCTYLMRGVKVIVRLACAIAAGCPNWAVVVATDVHPDAKPSNKSMRALWGARFRFMMRFAQTPKMRPCCCILHCRRRQRPVAAITVLLTSTEFNAMWLPVFSGVARGD